MNWNETSKFSHKVLQSFMITTSACLSHFKKTSIIETGARQVSNWPNVKTGFFGEDKVISEWSL